jgi:hypothetical protein
MSARHSAYRSKLVEAAELSSLVPDWQDLAGRSIEANVYYEPHYALALIDTVARRTNVKFLTVWNGDLLVALLPVRRPACAVPGLVPSGRAWQSLFTFSCTPLIDRSQPEPSAAALLAGLAGLASGEWVIPRLNVNGPACRALTGALGDRGAPWRYLAAFQRASLATGQSFESHLQQHLGSKRRRELARNRRRLEERGQVTHESHSSGPSLARAVDAFLRLEAGGWKGKRGTALLCDKDTRDFAVRAFNSQHEGVCRADLLLLDGTPIAAGLTVFAGRTGFTVKNAYDEAYASFSAGLLLEVEVLRSFLTERWAERLDSATSGSHVIDSLWPDRIEVADLAFSLSRVAPRLRLAAYAQSASFKSRAKSSLKRLLNRG